MSVMSSVQLLLLTAAMFPNQRPPIGVQPVRGHPSRQRAPQRARHQRRNPARSNRHLYPMKDMKTYSGRRRRNM
jgi:hypothetical protein